MTTDARTVLTSPEWTIPAGPVGDSGGIRWLRHHVARFAAGADHARRRRYATDALDAVASDGLRRAAEDATRAMRGASVQRVARTVPVAVLAAALGLPALPDGLVGAVAEAYQPDTGQEGPADDAVARLVGVLGGVADEATAARIALLVQAFAATAGLVEHAARTLVADPAVAVERALRADPPVRSTRRIDPATGAVVPVDLAAAGLPFGAGEHGCPGREQAVAIAVGVLAALGPSYRFASFRDLHRPGAPLVLPNAWDHATATALVGAGFTAVGTTSLGVAAALGVPDGHGLIRGRTVALVRSLAALQCLCTADIEGGFSDDPAEVAALATELRTAGAVGVNLEDGLADGTLADPARLAGLIGAVKAAEPDLFVNARVDTRWLDAGGPAETTDRALRYQGAGADGVFVPGIAIADIPPLVAVLAVPLNVLYQPSGPTVAQLAELGVGRVSTGSLLFRTALRAVTDAAVAVRAGRPLGADVPSYRDIQDGLLASGQRPD